MTDLIIATRNKDKIKEMRELLKDTKVNVIPMDDGPWSIPDIEEDGATFKENAVKKAKTIAGITGKIVLADDSGLEVDFLEGKPGIYSARFAGADATDRDNNLKLLGLMREVPQDRRGAQFVCAVAIVGPESETECVEGVCRGEIAVIEKGGQGFGYDPVFIPSGHNKTFAELRMEIKNKISHRGKALEKAKLILERMLIRYESGTDK